jgi:hypothetical protein
MTPLTDDEKRLIVTKFADLKGAIQTDDEVEAKFTAFQEAYRGDLRAYVDSFNEATDRDGWIGQLEIYLYDEIEAAFWRGVTVECHNCEKRFPQSDAMWFTPFGGGAAPGEDGGLDTYATLSPKPGPGSVPYCPTCVEEMKQRDEA